MALYIDAPKFLPAGESCVFVEFANEVDRSANDAVTRLKSWFDAKKAVGVRECVPTYRSLAIYFNPLVVSMDEIIQTARKGLSEPAKDGERGHTLISVPVCYGGEYGPDIANVAEHAGITVEEVISRHTGCICHCYMIGFMPGFAYLGGMDESIATPRLANPRSVIPGGSVGIAGKQTGIYPMESPGGWQLIGRTPLRLFTPEAASPTLIKAGYEVKFTVVSAEEYAGIASRVASGTYEPDLSEVE